MRQIWFGLLSVLFCFAASGCDIKVGDDGVRIKAPGVDIDVHDEDGVKVEAPGVDINVDDDDVEVKAPGINIQVDEDKVKVDAPGVDVDVNDKEGVSAEKSDSSNDK